MASTPTVASPALLGWARRSAGLSQSEAAKKASVSEERLASWEDLDGDARPTLRQLRLLANAYKRPIAVFFLPEPPRDFQPLRDFRRLPDEPESSESASLRFEVRRAELRREVALELIDALEEEQVEFNGDGESTDKPPDEVATRLRDRLGVSLEGPWDGKT